MTTRVGGRLSALDEVVESVDGLLGVDRAGGMAGERFAGVLVGDVEDLDRPPVGGSVVEVVERPHLIRLGGGDRTGGTRLLLASKGLARHVQALVTPQPLHPLAVALPALALEQHVHPPVVVAGMTTCEQIELLPQQRLVGCSPWLASLR